MSILGTIAVITSLVFMAMGLPIQIFKIYRAKTTDDVPLFTQCTLLLATTTAWCVYALSIENWYILISNAPGVVFASIILLQFWLYHHRKPEAIEPKPSTLCCIIVEVTGWGGDMHERLAMLDVRQVQTYLPDLSVGQEIWYTHRGGTSLAVVVQLIDEETLKGFTNYRKHTLTVDRVSLK